MNWPAHFPPFLELRQNVNNFLADVISIIEDKF
jgi:hypothetical protein